MWRQNEMAQPGLEPTTGGSYMLDGGCQLQDYQAILRVLERAFGDPNRINNARKELFRLRRSNREFGTFYAEFQRLALEVEVNEESQLTLLQDAVSRELKNHLISVDLPDLNVHGCAEYFQNLENRRRYYQQSAEPAMRPHSTWPVNQNPNIKTYAVASRPTEPPAATPTAAHRNDPDVMDTSALRRTAYSRAETRSCYRCAAHDHFVRNCSKPDTRRQSQRNVGAAQGRSRSWSRKSRLRRSSDATSTGSNTVKGVSLEQVATRLRNRAT